MNASTNLLKNTHLYLKDKFDLLEDIVNKDIYKNEEIKNIFEVYKTELFKEYFKIFVSFILSFIISSYSLVVIFCFINNTGIIPTLVSIILPSIISSFICFCIIIYLIKDDLTYILTNKRIIVKNPIHNTHINYDDIIDITYDDNKNEIILSTMKNEKHTIINFNDKNVYYDEAKTILKSLNIV